MGENQTRSTVHCGDNMVMIIMVIYDYANGYAYDGDLRFYRNTMMIMINDYDEKTCMTSKQEANTTGETETLVFFFIDFKIIANMR